MSTDTTTQPGSAVFGFVARHPVALIALAVAIAGAQQAVKLGIGGLSEPEPGLWPLISCCMLGIGALLCLLEEGGNADEELEPRDTPRFVLATLGLILFVPVFTTVGVTAASVVVALVWIRFVAKESWRLAIITAVVTGLAMWLVFEELLGVPMPGLHLA